MILSNLLAEVAKECNDLGDVVYMTRNKHVGENIKQEREWYYIIP